MHTVNKLEAQILEKLQNGPLTRSEIIKAVRTTYGVDKTLARLVKEEKVLFENYFKFEINK